MSTTWESNHRPDIDELRELTQKDRMREMLRSAGADGLCSLLAYGLHGRNGRNRVYELRDDDGLEIETFRCDLKTYHAGENDVPGHVRWVWWWNGNPRQQVLRLLRLR